MDGLVSVIMPAFNSSAYIEQSIKSVISQTYSNWELIIVDDCSTDDTVDVVKNIHDSRIRLFVNSQNVGAGGSRNFALSKAKGKWIAFLDSDDIWDEMKLEKQISFMIKNNYSFSYTEYTKVDADEKPLKYISGPAVINHKLMRCYCWPGCLTVMFEKKICPDLQIVNIKKNNDYAMWLIVSKKCNCYLLKEKLAYYREHEGSISNHSYMHLIKWHYIIFRRCEKENCIVSFLDMMCNLMFGILKKIVYEKEVLYDKR